MGLVEFWYFVCMPSFVTLVSQLMNNWLKCQSISPFTHEVIRCSFLWLGLDCFLTGGMRHISDLLNGCNVPACID